jgi:hypothetical protein
MAVGGKGTAGGTMRKKIYGIEDIVRVLRELEQHPEKYVGDESLWYLRCAIVDIVRVLRELAAAKPMPKRRKT